MKEQDKFSEKQLNEVEIDNLPGKEVRIMIMKMVQDGEDVKNVCRNFYQRFSRTKNIQTEMNNTLEGINSRITEAKKNKNKKTDK